MPTGDQCPKCGKVGCVCGPRQYYHQVVVDPCPECGMDRAPLPAITTVGWTRTDRPLIGCCGDCVYWGFEKAKTASRSQYGDGETPVGKCRESSPRIDGWPWTGLDDWCGDFMPKPEDEETP